MGIDLPQRIKDMISSGDLEMMNLGCQIAFREYHAEYMDMYNLLDNIKYELIVSGPFDQELQVIERQLMDFGTIDLWAMKQKTESPLIQLSELNSPGKTIYHDGTYVYEVPTARQRP